MHRRAIRFEVDFSQGTVCGTIYIYSARDIRLVWGSILGRRGSSCIILRRYACAYTLGRPVEGRTAVGPSSYDIFRRPLLSHILFGLLSTLNDYRRIVEAARVPTRARTSGGQSVLVELYVWNLPSISIATVIRARQGRTCRTSSSAYLKTVKYRLSNRRRALATVGSPPAALGGRMAGRVCAEPGPGLNVRGLFSFQCVSQTAVTESSRELEWHNSTYTSRSGNRAYLCVHCTG